VPKATLIEAIRELSPQIVAAAEQAERDRRLPGSLVEAMGNAGLFRMCVPRSLGGSENHPIEIIGVLEALAQVDASTAWVTMIAATGGLFERLPGAGDCAGRLCRWRMAHGWCCRPERCRKAGRRWAPDKRALGVRQRVRAQPLDGSE